VQLEECLAGQRKEVEQGQHNELIMQQEALKDMIVSRSS